MFNKDMYALGSKRSSIRELFEYGKKRANEVGAENVFDFSLGNPNVPAPDCVKDALVELANSCETLHGYTSAQGDVAVREAVAKNISRRFGVDVGKDLIYMTCGAAASLCITLRALNENNNEFVVLAPYFPEYKVFIESAGGKAVIADYDEKDFTPDLSTLEQAIGKTRRQSSSTPPTIQAASCIQKIRLKKSPTF